MCLLNINISWSRSPCTLKYSARVTSSIITRTIKQKYLDVCISNVFAEQSLSSVCTRSLLLLVVGIAKRKTYLEIARLCRGWPACGGRRPLFTFCSECYVRQTLVVSTWPFLCALSLIRPLCHFWTTTPISGLVTAAAQIANKKQIGFGRLFELDSLR